MEIIEQDNNRQQSANLWFINRFLAVEIRLPNRMFVMTTWRRRKPHKKRNQIRKTMQWVHIHLSVCFSFWLMWISWPCIILSVFQSLALLHKLISFAMLSIKRVCALLVYILQWECNGHSHKRLQNRSKRHTACDVEHFPSKNVDKILIAFWSILMGILLHFTTLIKSISVGISDYLIQKKHS